MVNHVMTLLLDLPGQGFATGPGEEYTPPDYAPPAAPAYLVAARAALFGARPDHATRWYRMRQFLACLHATPLAEFVTAQDPRLTYMPLAERRFLLPGTAVHDLAALPAALEGIGAENLEALFGTSAAEPRATWRNLWRSRMPLPYRLGALLLAVAAATDALRAGDAAP